jgi:hypothetical protein
MRRSKGRNVELTREPHEVALETWDNLTNQIAPVRNLSPTTVDTTFVPREMHKVENDLENDEKESTISASLDNKIGNRGTNKHTNLTGLYWFICT